MTTSDREKFIADYIAISPHQRKRAETAFDRNTFEARIWRQARAALDGGAVSPTDNEIEQWAESFIRQQAYNRPVAIQIAMEAAKFVRGRTQPQRDGGAVSQDEGLVSRLERNAYYGRSSGYTYAPVAFADIDAAVAALRAPQQQTGKKNE